MRISFALVDVLDRVIRVFLSSRKWRDQLGYLLVGSTESARETEKGDVNI